MQTWQQSLSFLRLNASMARYTRKNNVFFGKLLKKTHFRITIPIRGCSSIIWHKAGRHESESVKTMYLEAIEYLICSRVLTIAQTSALNTDAESGNIMEITVSDGNTVAQATEFPSREPSVSTGM